ncbi:MAG: DUF4190 domain-containing protein [Flavobacteriales bacterium]|nr:DUF4190 domain-containing protein [Flavobacteriales bacterium]
MTSGKLIWNITFMLLICFIAGGCGNMTIVKRKHLPGFHVDRSAPPKTLKERQTTHQPDNDSTTDENDDKTERATISGDRQIAENQIASIEPARPDLTAKSETDILKPIDGLFSTSLGKTQKDKISVEFRRAVFGQEEDDREWNELGIVSMILGACAIALMLAAGILTLRTNGSHNYGFIFIGAGTAVVSAIITGIIALKKQKFKTKKGRGFAIAGIAAGVLSFAAFIIALFVELVMLIIQILS